MIAAKSIGMIVISSNGRWNVCVESIHYSISASNRSNHSPAAKVLLPPDFPRLTPFCENINRYEYANKVHRHILHVFDAEVGKVTTKVPHATSPTEHTTGLQSSQTPFKLVQATSAVAHATAARHMPVPAQKYQEVCQRFGFARLTSLDSTLNVTRGIWRLGVYGGSSLANPVPLPDSSWRWIDFGQVRGGGDSARLLRRG
ncbi:hypothetical protein JCGZ_07841 [Jatropha curcas]|uniref:Uncharacterized protein n=1 Tax=Jatropha curcas TaxID=180498 RepID=A0A067KN34_JATCU|nr:hypothetical protein JCGZ_07841 [Jatropha curcas]